MRCQQHDLACGPDGRCVLCHRSEALAYGRSPKKSLLGLMVAALVAATGAGVLAYRVREVSPPMKTPAHVIGMPTGNREEIAAATPRQVTGPADSADSKSERRADWLRAAARGTPAASATTIAANTVTAPPEPLRTEAPTPRASIAGVPVVVYTTSWCPVCRRAKAWLRSNGIAYEERDIEGSSEYARKIRLLNPRASIPTFDVDGDVAIGFSEGQLTSMLERAAQRRSERR
jgi:glutaredoxin